MTVTSSWAEYGHETIPYSCSGLCRRLSTDEVLVFRRSIASVMAANGITLDMITMGEPEATAAASGRRLLQVLHP